MESVENGDTRSQLFYLIAKRVATVAAVFALILSTLLITNFIQTRSVAPLKSEAVAQLMRQLQDNPDDTGLQEQIRALDLLARRAYFTHQWQLRTGSYLLFAFVLAFLIAVKYLQSLRQQLPDLSAAAPSGDAEVRFLTRRYILIGGLALFVVAFILGVIAESDIEKIGSVTSEGLTSTYPSLEEMNDNWPNFRGPQGVGHAYHTDVPTHWNGRTGENIIWKSAIPLTGYSSPVVWGDRIFLTGGDKLSQTVYCIGARQGEILWQAEVNDVPGSPPEKPRVSRETGYAAPSMAVDGQRAYAIFSTGDIVALDFEGNRLWAKNLGLPDNHYGHSSSLITHQNLLLVQYDQNTGGQLLALEITTGELVYNVTRDAEISWASPILITRNGRAEIVLNSTPSVISYDPVTGTELWKVRCMQGEIGPSLGYADGMVYAVNEFARLAAITVGDTAEVAWEYLDDLSEVSSPVATSEVLIVATSYGTVSCFNSASGERYWYHDFDQGFYSSPTVVGDAIYLMDLKGVTHIFKAAPEFELINECELGENAVTIPAFMHDRIYIRGDNHLFCIGNR